MYIGIEHHKHKSIVRREIVYDTYVHMRWRVSISNIVSAPKPSEQYINIPRQNLTHVALLVEESRIRDSRVVCHRT